MPSIPWKPSKTATSGRFAQTSPPKPLGKQDFYLPTPHPAVLSTISKAYFAGSSVPR